MLNQLGALGLVAPEPEPEFFVKYSELLWHHCNSALAFEKAEPNAAALADAAVMLRVLLLPTLTATGRALLALPRDTDGREAR